MLILADEELAARCKVELPGDTRSYEMLVQRHMNRVFSIVFRIVCNREEAEDVTQEVFIKVYNGLKKFEQQSSFTTWLYRIATNTALDALEKTKRRPVAVVTTKPTTEVEESDLLSLQVDPNAKPEDDVIQTELRQCIGGVLKKLEKDQARLLVMRDFEDLSYDEIAKALKVGLSAVKMRIHRARLAFQDLFGKACEQMYTSFSTAKSDKSKG